MTCTRVGRRSCLVWVMGPCLAIYSADLLLQGGASQPVVLLSLLTSWLPAAVCWLAVLWVGFRRWEMLLAALAVTSLAVGDTFFVALAGDLPSRFPTPGDLGYLLFYLLMLAKMVMLVRREVRAQSSSVWLDCAVGSLGAASVLAVVLNPALTAALKGPFVMATTVAVAYPLLDLLLVAAVSGIIAVRGVRGGDRMVLLMVGLIVYAIGDVVYALRVTSGGHAPGTPLDALGAIGIALIALHLHGAARVEDSSAQDATRTIRATPQARAAHTTPSGPATPASALMMSGLATAAGLGVLFLSSRTQLSTLAVLLAAVTLLAAAARTQIAFRLLVKMADLRRQATTDHLTGLPNRRALYAQADARMADRQHQHQALLLLDLDRFKEVNDSLGHQAGDQLLIQVGARLSDHLRVGDLLVRLGGDEFAVLLDDADRKPATAVALKLCTALAEPFTVEDIAVHSAVSIGIAVFPHDGADLNTLLRKADIAMYKAKASGDGHHLYGGTDDADFSARLRTVDELRTALVSDQLVVHYQPKIDLGTGEVHSVEALVRWDHPTRGLLYPDSFLDVVEEAGLMPTLTRIVLKIALDQAAEWHEQGKPLTVAVNLSASSLVDTDLPRQVGSMLEARALPPGALQLEITEEFLMADRDRAHKILTRLRNIRVQISVDDFGTGYSSLSYLRDLPVDELKLDRSFVFPMADDARAAALVASTIDLAHSLGLRMVAEGVETEAAYDELARLGCDQAQGTHMSRPVPAAELDRWLTIRRNTGCLIGEQPLLSVAVE